MVQDNGPTKSVWVPAWAVACKGAEQIRYYYMREEVMGAAPWQLLVVYKGVLHMWANSVRAQRRWPRDAPTLAASNAGYSNGSCSPDKSQLFFHFDNESVLYFFSNRSIWRLCSRLSEARNLLSALDPNLINKRKLQ